MSVHSTNGPERVEVRRTALTGDVMLRVWDESPEHRAQPILADLRLSREQVDALTDALLLAVNA